MKSFAEILNTLPQVSHLEALELYRGETLVDTIPNQPGKSGSLRVYYALSQDFGQLDAESAQAGLELFAEHVTDADAHPGKHPNIDRLRDVITHNECLQLRPIERTVGEDR